MRSASVWRTLWPTVLAIWRWTRGWLAIRTAWVRTVVAALAIVRLLAIAVRRSIVSAIPGLPIRRRHLSILHGTIRRWRRLAFLVVKRMVEIDAPELAFATLARIDEALAR